MPNQTKVLPADLEMNECIVRLTKRARGVFVVCYLTQALARADVQGPLVVMKAASLYMATPSAVVFKSGKSFSSCFFFGLITASGSPEKLGKEKNKHERCQSKSILAIVICSLTLRM